MKTHDLKTWPEYFQAVLDGRKLFEIRKDDRGFQVGDSVQLEEYDPQLNVYSGRAIVVEITYVTPFGQPDGQVVFGFEKLMDVQRAGWREF